MATKPIKPKLLNREQAATYLLEVWGVKRTARTLRVFSVTPGRGPNFVKVGINALYSPDDLDAWVRSITKPPKKQQWSGVTAEFVWPVGNRKAVTTTQPSKPTSTGRKPRSRSASTSEAAA